MNIGPNILRFRREKGLSLVQLARRLDTHPSNVKRWERGRVSPRWETVVRIAEALGVPVEDLAAGEDTRSPFRLSADRPRPKGGDLFSEENSFFASAAPEEEDHAEVLHTQSLRMADNLERRARDYRALSRFLRHPRYRRLREAIADLPDDLSQEELNRLAALVRETMGRGRDG